MPGRAPPRGGIIVRADDFNPERMIIDDAIVGSAAFPTVNVGDHFNGALVGIVDYNFGNFMIELTTPPTATAGGIAREIDQRQRWRQVGSPWPRSTSRTSIPSTIRSPSSTSWPSSSSTTCARRTWSRSRKSRTTTAKTTTALGVSGR